MADFSLGMPDPLAGQPGFLPVHLSITGWTLSYTSDGALYTETPVFGRNPNQLQLYFDTAGNVITVVYRTAPPIGSHNPGLMLAFTAYGLSTPLAAFQANAADLMPLLLAGDDTIQGNSFGELLTGLAGNDRIFGGNGADQLEGGDGDDWLVGESGDDDLYGGAGNDALRGLDGNDRLYGGDGNDLLTGSSGADVIDGGIGQDTADYTDAQNGVIVNLTTGTGTGGEALGDTYFSIESVNGTKFNDVLTAAAPGESSGSTLRGGAGDDEMYGAAGRDFLYGQSGVDKLYGGAGDDYLAPGTAVTASLLPDVVDGGDGVDTISYEDTSDAMRISLAAGTAFVGTWTQVAATIANVENVACGGGNDQITGNSAGNKLYGGGGDDVLSPGRSNLRLNVTDLVDGGAGLDTVSFADIASWGYATIIGGVSVNLTNGLATEINPLPSSNPVYATLVSIENATGGSGNDVLSGNIGTNVLSGGEGADQLYGGDGSDALYGGGGSDILRGDAGADIINGGAGIDRADYNSALTGVTVDLTIGTSSDGDTLTGVENLFGSGLNDILIGSSDANTFYGYNGNDRLSGLGGNDWLLGQDGNDVLIGGDGNDYLSGGSGGDILRGDAGADAIDGGAGIDRADYNSALTGVTVHLTNGTSSDGDTLTGIEDLFGSGLNDILIGSSGANTFYGYNGNDQLLGLAGDDWLIGQADDDALFGGEGGDFLSGGDGNDGLFGEEANDSLYGGYGDDYLSGGDGNDVIWGEAGNDQIDAGAGSDFVVLGAGDDEFILGLGDDRVRFDYGNGIDVIRDFGNGSDIIDFTATDMTRSVLQANTVDTAAGALMTLGSGSILLEGLHLPQIDWAGDFVFAI